jgi:hypothetical protein
MASEPLERLDGRRGRLDSHRQRRFGVVGQRKRAMGAGTRTVTLLPHRRRPSIAKRRRRGRRLEGEATFPAMRRPPSSVPDHA